MSEKLSTLNPDWVDLDDAPELTKEWFATATPMIGDQVVSREKWVQAVVFI